MKEHDKENNRLRYRSYIKDIHMVQLVTGATPTGKILRRRITANPSLHNVQQPCCRSCFSIHERLSFSPTGLYHTSSHTQPTIPQLLHRSDLLVQKEQRSGLWGYRIAVCMFHPHSCRRAFHTWTICFIGCRLRERHWTDTLRFFLAVTLTYLPFSELARSLMCL